MRSREVLQVCDQVDTKLCCYGTVTTLPISAPQKEINELKARCEAQDKQRAETLKLKFIVQSAKEQWEKDFTEKVRVLSAAVMEAAPQLSHMMFGHSLYAF